MLHGYDYPHELAAHALVGLEKPPIDLARQSLPGLLDRPEVRLGEPEARLLPRQLRIPGLAEQ